MTHPVQESVRSCGESLLHAPYWNLSRRSAGAGLSLTHRRTGICLVVGSGGESILHALSWHLSRRSSGWRRFSYTPRAAVCPVVKRVGNFSSTPQCWNLVLSFVGRGVSVSLTRLVLVCVSI